jgi:hypothetical protein
MDPGYLATIIDWAVPVFLSPIPHRVNCDSRLIAVTQETVRRAHQHVQHTRTLMILLANINRLVLAVKALIPQRACDEWFTFIPEGGSATSPRWDTVRVLFFPIQYFDLAPLP